MSRTILFVFAGRQPNMDLQLPLVRRILEQNPDVEYHIWNLARSPSDRIYLHSIRGDRITVRHDFAGDNSWRRFNDVYRHYTSPEYEGCVFVKIDDDVVFMETAQFSSFVGNVREGTVLSAKVINNGACTATEPALWAGFEQLDIPLLDVHLSAEYAEMCHHWFFQQWQQAINQPPKLTPTEDWLSINMIGYTHQMGVEITKKLSRPAPREIAGRFYNPHRNRMGDEGAVNTFPRVIHEGVTACHLYFGPQAKQLTDPVLTQWRERYLQIGQQYLGLHSLHSV